MVYTKWGDKSFLLRKKGGIYKGAEEFFGESEKGAVSFFGQTEEREKGEKVLHPPKPGYGTP